MSFRFRWPDFSAEFYATATQLLNVALNKGSKPPQICDEIRLTRQPPELELLEIGDLSTEKFRGTLRLTYRGDAHLVLETRVQVNPVTTAASSMGGDPGLVPFGPMVSAHKPLVVPMQLKLSQLRLRGILVLVIDQQKGVTLCFKNDPLESVEVNSTFDDMAPVKTMLHRQIDKQLRLLLTEELPAMIHQLSLAYMGLKEESVEEVLRRQSSNHQDVSRLGSLGWRGSRDSGLGSSMDGLDQSLKPDANLRVDTQRIRSDTQREGWTRPFGLSMPAAALRNAQSLPASPLRCRPVSMARSVASETRSIAVGTNDDDLTSVDDEHAQSQSVPSSPQRPRRQLLAEETRSLPDMNRLDRQRPPFSPLVRSILAPGLHSTSTLHSRTSSSSSHGIQSILGADQESPRIISRHKLPQPQRHYPA